MKRSIALATLAVAGALVLGGCGGSDPTKSDDNNGNSSGSTKSVTVGSANFPESVVLAEVYAKALEDKGFKVDTKLNIGSREAYLKAIEDGELGVFPEYTGNLRLYYDKNATASAPDDVYNELVAALPDTLKVLDKAPAEDKDAVVVTKETADKYSLKSIADLKDVAKDLTLGGPPEWKTRETGVPGLKDKYGVVFKDFRELDAGGPLTLKALQNGQVDAGNMFTTDPNVANGSLVALEDPVPLFAAQNVVPLIRKDVDSADLDAALNAVSAALTQEQLLSLVDEVVAQKKDPADVASTWVEANVK